MKFRFCGDADCPDWLLMQINTLSGLPADNILELCKCVAASLLGEDVNYKKVEELTKGALLDINDMKACLAAVSFILRSSACYQVSSRELSAELEQLGLDRTHSTAVTQVYSDHVDQLTDILRSESLRIGRMKNLNINKEGGEYKVEMTVWDEEKAKEKLYLFTMDQSKITLLLSDLKSVKARMEELKKPTQD